MKWYGQRVYNLRFGKDSSVIVAVIIAVFFLYHTEDDGKVVSLPQGTLGKTGCHRGAGALVYLTWVVHPSGNSLNNSLAQWS